MLFYVRLPKEFWTEAVNTACFLVNRCPSSAIGIKTLVEVWSGTLAKHDNLEIFCCPDYSHINEGNLERRANKFVFLGYPEGVKVYKYSAKMEIHQSVSLVGM